MGQNDIIEVRKLLLDFYSSELTTHSRLIIGFSVILLTILQIAQKLQEESTISDWQLCICMFSIWLTAGVLWYLLMRHISYGILSDSVISVTDNQNMTLKEVIAKVRNHALSHRILAIFPSCLFISSGEKVTKLQKRFGLRVVVVLGFILCFLIFGIITTVLLTMLIGLI